ncbi:hypothetical protein NPIL_586291 [Nephila pilipes]|uniref:Uncharacterized protein n=1 Tax=Nephila pilipes TaxID=299642 RepID=A0A8X6JGV8_NEPPI|nr:hypothetical protein NPIL_586291 [Nephila pilipes]
MKSYFGTKEIAKEITSKRHGYSVIRNEKLSNLRASKSPNTKNPGEQTEFCQSIKVIPHCSWKGDTHAREKGHKFSEWQVMSSLGMQRFYSRKSFSGSGVER